MEVIEQFKALAETIFPEVLNIRRYLHENPELSFEEYKTSAFVFEKLREFGLKPVSGVAGTGVVCLIEGNPGSKKTIALRADMDALPIQEMNDLPYKSKIPGVMHACGHDVHTSSLLGTAWILSQLKDQFSGQVKLIFQPGEEKAPGGASIMIKEGVLANPRPDTVFGQHVMPQIEAGKVGFKPGLYMASADEIHVKIIGKGGHGAMPDLNVDPVLISSHIIVALQQVVSRNANPRIPSVLSIGKVIANGATNVIPDEVYLEGTFRTLDESWRNEALKKIYTLIDAIATGMGGRAQINIVKGYPFLYNEPTLTGWSREKAIEYLGKENVVDLEVWMAAEDFAYYSQEIGACFYRLGVGNPRKGIVSSVHTSTFNIDDEALKIGPGLMGWLAFNALATH